MPEPWTESCWPEGPQSFRDALGSSDAATGNSNLVGWAKQATKEHLEEAKARIPKSRDGYLAIIEKELVVRRHQKIIIGLRPHWTLVPTFWLVLSGTIAAFVFGVAGCIIGLKQANESHPIASAPQVVISPIPKNNKPSPPKAVLPPAPKATNAVVAPSSPKK